MKKYFCIILSAAIVISVLSFSACTKKENNEEKTTTSATTEITKATTAVPVKIIDVPETAEEHLQMFNAALDFFELYCYRYTKTVKCDVSDVSVGSLSAASNAVDAFKSIFGQADANPTDYDYSTGQESFSNNAIKSGFNETDVMTTEAKENDGNIILKFTFANESNPTETTGQLHKLTSEFLSVEEVNQNLGDFNSSASSVNISVSDITVEVVLNAQDSSPKSVSVSFTKKFSLSGVKLSMLEGSSVTGTSKTTITYDNIK